MTFVTEDSFIRTLLEGVGTFAMFLIGLFVRGHSERIAKIENDARRIEQTIDIHVVEAERYKLSAEQRFAKDETMQMSLSRIHDRLDRLPKELRDLLKPTGNA